MARRRAPDGGRIRSKIGTEKVMSKVIASIALGAASVGIVAEPVGAGAEAKQPSPEAMQAWYRTPPKKTTTAASPEASILSLNLLYGVMFEFKAQDNDERFDAGRAGSKEVDKVRKTLTHSPDRKLNKQMDRALNRVGDAFDAIGFDDAEAVGRSEGLWAKIEAKLQSYGVDTGEPWALSGNPPPLPPPPPSVTYDLTGQGTVSVTMQNASGGTEQFETRLPYHLDLGGASGFVYISAQLQDTGTVTCEIKQGDQVVQTATSTGQYVIATCSGYV
jgi:hypothetical protein